MIPDPPAGLQLDLLTAVLRLRQVRDSQPGLMREHLVERLATCDLPRLAGYLNADTRDWAACHGEAITERDIHPPPDPPGARALFPHLRGL